jgi:uncharacterized protein YrzB (UPF0473 family)
MSKYDLTTLDVGARVREVKTEVKKMEEVKVGEFTIEADVEDVWDNEAPRLKLHIYKNDEYVGSSGSFGCGHVDEDERWNFVEEVLKKSAEELERGELRY